jgi:hypothetical protein
MVLLADCSSTRQSKPEVRGSLSPRDVADVQAQVRQTARNPILWIEESGDKVEVYTGDKRGDGIVYLFHRDKTGRLDGCGSGWWGSRD